MEDLLVFEVPTHRDALRLYDRIEDGRLCFIELAEDAWNVSVSFTSDDFATILREAEVFVAVTGLYALPYHVDGRMYALVAGDVSVENVSAAARIRW
jgi:hypothetical protein